MVDLINAAVAGNSTTNSRRPDGQAQTPQANVRQEPQAQQPQVQPPASPQQTQQAVNQSARNDGVALLNNREQVASNAIQQRSATPELATQRIQVDTDPVVQPQQTRQSTEAAIESSVRINTQQQPSTPQAAQQLVNTAQSALDNVRQAQQPRPDTEAVAERVQRQAQQERAQPGDVGLRPDTADVTQNRAEQTLEARPAVQTPQAQPAVAAPQPQAQEPVQVQEQQQVQQQANFDRAQAQLVEEQQQQAQQPPVRPTTAEQEAAPQVGFASTDNAAPQAQSQINALNPDAVVGDILRPDFNQFVGLRASIPASAQDPQVNENQNDSNENDNQEREPVDFEA